MVKKAIFGGTFNPIHNGHLHIAYEALNSLNLDKVIFVPAGDPPHKTGKVVTDAVDRYNIVNVAVRNEEKFEVSPYEINKKGKSYTYMTLRYFHNLEPETEWYFITGTDCLVELHLWKNVDKILDLCKFVVFSRPGYNEQEVLYSKKCIEEKYNCKLILVEIPTMEISSTMIREKIKKGEDVSDYLPEGVYDAIIELGLYRKVN